MSADNFYVIRKHPQGGYAAVMGFASDESEESPEVRSNHHQSFATVSDALDYASGEYSEYGVSVHPECRDDLRVEDLAAIPTDVLVSELARREA